MFIVRNIWSITAILLIIIGFAGVPDDLTTWWNWLLPVRDKYMTFAPEFNQSYFRTIILCLGVILFFVSTDAFAKIYTSLKTLFKKPSIKIEHDENDDRYFYESEQMKMSEVSLKILFSDGSRDTILWRLCRVSIKNLTEETIKHVEVKLTDIEPCPPQFNKGILPLNLIFKDDRSPFKKEINLNPDKKEFIDVIQWQYHGEEKPWLSIQNSIAGVKAEFPTPTDDRTCKIKIEVSGENVNCESRYFYFGMVNKDKIRNKLRLWPERS